MIMVQSIKAEYHPDDDDVTLRPIIYHFTEGGISLKVGIPSISTETLLKAKYHP